MEKLYELFAENIIDCGCGSICRQCWGNATSSFAIGDTCNRNERIKFLTSVGIPFEEVNSKIPIKYTPIPDFIWLDVIMNILKKLEKREEILENDGFDSFAISGHTEGRKFTPWQMFDKGRYTKTLKK